MEDFLEIIAEIERDLKDNKAKFEKQEKKLMKLRDTRIHEKFPRGAVLDVHFPSGRVDTFIITDAWIPSEDRVTVMGYMPSREEGDSACKYYICYYQNEWKLRGITDHGERGAFCVVKVVLNTRKIEM
jgi:hypothetical protein